MKSRLFTMVPNPSPVELFTVKGKTVALGSCFVENIFEPYAELGLDIIVNPFGVLYNPISIAQLLERALEKRPFTLEDIFQDGTIWRSFHCHSSQNRESSGELLNSLNKNIEMLSERLTQANLLCLTFGTAFYWELLEGNLIVANCQKQPGNLFEKKLATEQQLIDSMCTVLKRLKEDNPQIAIQCTVSPVRYEKGNPYLNSLSKGRLFQMIEVMKEEFPIHYFPAYEILLDELRDYRFYSADLRHPSPLAISIIQERYLNTYTTSETRNIVEELLGISTFLSHRDSGKESTVYLQQLQKVEEKLQTLEAKLGGKLPLLRKRIAEKAQT